MRGRFFFVMSLIAVTFLAATPVRAEDENHDEKHEKPNCKLVVHVWKREGGRKLEVLEMHAESREDCKFQARNRELSSEYEVDAKVKVTYGWRP